MAIKVVKWGIHGNFMSIPTEDRVIVCVNKEMNKLEIILNSALIFQWTHASIPLNYDGEPHAVELSKNNELFNNDTSFIDIDDGVLRYSATKINGVPLIAFQLDKAKLGARTIDPSGDGVYSPKDISGDWNQVADSVQNGLPNLITSGLDLAGGFISGAWATQATAALAAVLQAHPVYGVITPAKLTKTDKGALLTEVTTKGWNEYNKNSGYGTNKEQDTNASLSTMGMVIALGLIGALVLFITKNK